MRLTYSVSVLGLTILLISAESAFAFGDSPFMPDDRGYTTNFGDVGGFMGINGGSGGNGGGGNGGGGNGNGGGGGGNGGGGGGGSGGSGGGSGGFGGFSLNNLGNTGASMAAPQKTYQMQSVELSSLGSQINAAAGVVNCAEAANTLESNAKMSGALMESCVHSFTAANKMKNMELEALKNMNAKGTDDLTAYEKLLNSDQASEILEDLEKAYGIPKEEFIKKLIEARGKTGVMGEKSFINDLFGGKVDHSKVMAAVDEANELTAEEKEKLLAESRAAGLADQYAYELENIKSGYLAKGKDLKSLKDVLRERSKSDLKGAEKGKLAGRGNTSREPASKSMFGQESLTPMDNDPFMTEAASEREKMSSLYANKVDEDSIFQMVRNKYVEKFTLMAPLNH